MHPQLFDWAIKKSACLEAIQENVIEENINQIVHQIIKMNLIEIVKLHEDPSEEQMRGTIIGNEPKFENSVEIIENSVKILYCHWKIQ